MRSSSLVSVLLVAAWGCGHTSAAPPSPPTPATVSRGSAGLGGAARGGSAAIVAPSTPIALDPDEAITPRELASIPDPVPGGNPTSPTANATRGASAGDTESTAELPRAVPSIDAQGASPRGAPAGDGRTWIWRVQVFASPDLAQADRIAKEASVRFGEPSVIEFEDALYKVRLGAFASEALAQTLRERAVQEGFPGAFRMRSTAP
jgi:hypothetical protein